MVTISKGQRVEKLGAKRNCASLAYKKLREDPCAGRQTRANPRCEPVSVDQGRALRAGPPEIAQPAPQNRRVAAGWSRRNFPEERGLKPEQRSAANTITSNLDGTSPRRGD